MVGALATTVVVSVEVAVMVYNLNKIGAFDKVKSKYREMKRKNPRHVKIDDMAMIA